MDQGAEPVAAVRKALQQLQGAFALGIIFAGQDDLMIAARKGSPLAIGHGTGEMYLGSDAIALAPFTDAITYLEEGDWAVLTAQAPRSSIATARASSARSSKRSPALCLIDKGNYRHFMAKEIHEQPEVISHTLANYLDMATARVSFPDLGVDLSKISRVTISACGTAYYAGLVAKYWIERYARVAGRYRCRLRVALPRNAAARRRIALFSFPSRARRPIRWRRFAIARPTSSASRPSSTSEPRRSRANRTRRLADARGARNRRRIDQGLYLPACGSGLPGDRHRPGARQDDRRTGNVRSSKRLTEVPRHIASILRRDEAFVAVAHELAKAADVLYLGRGSSFPIALEGALKLKEISYIHAEGYAAGELKHGPIALIDETVPVIVVAPEDDLFEKTVSNLQEVAARGGQMILISDADPIKLVARSLRTSKCQGFVTLWRHCFMLCRLNSSPTRRRY